MKATLKTALIATTLAVLAFSTDGRAERTAKDPTKCDCRVVVGYRRGGPTLSKSPQFQPIFARPHKDKMVAGQCETSWLWGMRCKR